MNTKVLDQDKLLKRISWDAIDSMYVKHLIELAKREDLSGEGLCAKPSHVGDLTTAALVGSGEKAQAHLVAKQAMCVVGLPLIPLINEVYEGDVELAPLLQEGAIAKKGDVIGVLKGSINNILKMERVFLNFIQYLSGIGTLTQRYIQALNNPRVRLLDTRKTTPVFRVLEKYAVSIGGGWNHRMGLYDRVMIKDNHLAAVSMSIYSLVQCSRKSYPEVPVEVEVDTLDQLDAGLQALPDVVLLDNFSLKDLEIACQRIQGKCLIEVSGGVNLSSIESIGRLPVDYISCGALTHQSQWVDIGLDWS